MNGWNYLIDDIVERIRLEEKTAKLIEIGEKIAAIRRDLENSDVRKFE